MVWKPRANNLANGRHTSEQGRMSARLGQFTPTWQPRTSPVGHWIPIVAMKGTSNRSVKSVTLVRLIFDRLLVETNLDSILALHLLCEVLA